MTVVLSSPSAARAAEATVRDARGDAKAPWDFVGIKVSNGDRLLRVRIQYRGALQTETGFLAHIGFDLRSAASSYLQPDFVADLLLNSSGTPNRRDLVRGTRKVTCRGFSIKVHRRQGVVRVTVPQRCFGRAAGRVRVTAYSYQVRGAPDEADYFDKYSRWIARR